MAFTSSLRSDGRLIANIKCNRYYTNGSPPGTFLSDSASSVLGTFRLSRFNRTKGFRKGKFSINPFEGFEWSCTCTQPEKPARLKNLPRQPEYGYKEDGLEISGYWATIFRKYSGVGLNPNFTNPVVEYPTANEVSSALVQTYAKLQKADFDIPVFIGELRETLEMLRNPLKGFRDLWNDFIRSSRAYSNAKRGKLADAYANQWLEYRYGFRPLISDIQNIIKILDEGISLKTNEINRCVRRPEPVTVRSYLRDWNADQYSSWMVLLDATETRMRTSGLACRLFYRWDDGFYQTLSKLGLLPSSIPSVAWELTRLSFVWDWWIAVGDWLSTLIVPLGLNILGNSLSYKISYESRIVINKGYYYERGNPTYRPATNLSKDFQSVEKLSYFSRQINLPTPAYPPVNLDFTSWNHVVDSLSLIWSNTKRPKLRG